MARRSQSGLHGRGVAHATGSFLAPCPGKTVLSHVTDEHHRYLSDPNRMRAFHRAIQETVKPGDVVLDLASGTGILGLLACRAGAQRLYSIEKTGIIELARAICRANGFEERSVFIKGLSTQVHLPERVDAVVCDQIGGFGVDAGVLEYLSDARRRFLKPGGRLVPSRVDLWLAPVESPSIGKQLRLWRNKPGGFHFLPALEWASNTVFHIPLRPAQLLSKPVRVASIDLYTCSAAAFRVEAAFKVRRRGTLHGIGGWFSARLSGRVRMTNSPLDRAAIDRKQVCFPLQNPIRLNAGERVWVRLHIEPKDFLVTWSVNVGRKRGGKDADESSGTLTATHSTFKGRLLSREDLQRTAPTFKPRLAPLGLVRLTVLNLCAGAQTLREIERAVYRRHRRLFGSPEEAHAFVAEVLASCAR